MQCLISDLSTCCCNLARLTAAVAAAAAADCPMLMQADSLVGKRAFFASKHLFVTPHVDGQLFPAGEHVVQSEDCLGLKQWTKEVRVDVGN
jgi:Cu2+-containing amine oxidase